MDLFIFYGMLSQNSVNSKTCDLYILSQRVIFPCLLVSIFHYLNTIYVNMSHFINLMGPSKCTYMFFIGLFGMHHSLDYES